MQKQFCVAMVAACPFPTHQGTQVFVRHLAEAQARAGHRVELISYGYGEAAQALGFTHHKAVSVNAGLRSGPGFKRVLNDAALGLKTQRVLGGGDFDVLHVHNVEGLLIGAALKAAGMKLPLVYHAHNTMRDELPTYFHRKSVQPVMRWLGRAFDGSMPRCADAVIVFDRHHRELQIRRGVRPEKIFVVRPSLDSQELRMTESIPVELPESRYLVYSGNPDGYQNLQLLWRAFARVQKSRPGIKLLILTRASPQDFGPEAPRGIEKQSVVFRRYATRAELVSYLRRAEVGLSTRTISTGFPVKLINYTQLGLKAVACKESVKAGAFERLWLADSDPAAFAQAVLSALDAPATHPSVASGFEIADTLTAYENVYDRVLRNKHLTSVNRSARLS